MSKIELNFNQLDQTLKKVLEVCVNEKTRDKLTAHTYGWHLPLNSGVGVPHFRDRYHSFKG